MTDPTIDSDDQIVDEVLPTRADDLAVPVNLDTIQPWHTARKQFIREHQWVHLTKRLLWERHGQPGLQPHPDGPTEVRYLTLPGIDHLDSRLIGEACTELGCQLTVTGFLAGGQRNADVARSKVREEALIKAGHLSDHSHTLPRRFEEIAHPDSQAFREIRNRGPFHIVNIDACGSIAKPTAQQGRTIDAIHNLLQFQLTEKSGPWLLFLTTHVHPQQIATETVHKLWQAVEKNALEDPGFAAEVRAMFAMADNEDIPDLKHSISDVGENFLKLFGLGFGKWALHLAKERTWRAKAHPAFCYATPAGDPPTLACLAFEFHRLPAPPDPFGVAQSGPITPPPHDGPSDSIRIARKIAAMGNLDVKMQDEHLRDEMAAHMRDLLIEAGYSSATAQQV